MPRASWRGFLRLSLVSCPIYLSPATTRTKPIRLHQVWQPAPVEVDEDDLPGRGGEQQGSERSVPRLRTDGAAADGEQSPAATRITLRPHDRGPGVHTGGEPPRPCITAVNDVSGRSVTTIEGLDPHKEIIRCRRHGAP